MIQKTKFKETEIGLIPEDWEVKEAQEYCLKVTDGTHDSPKKVKKGRYLITSRHIKNNDIDYPNAYFISDKDFEEINKRSVVNKNDVLFSMIGTIGEIYFVKEEPNYAIKNIGLFKFDEDKLKARWFYYFLKSPYAEEYIFSMSSGSTQQYMTLNSLRKFPIAFPLNVSEQSAIAKILSDLDSKIELLQKQNETLEKIGQAIFKQWFVDFEFPNAEGKPYKSSGGKMVESELGEIPQGWSVGKLGDFVDSVSGCSYTSKGLEKSEKALVTLKSISVNGFTQEGFKEYTSDYKNKHVVKDGDIVVAHTDLTQNRIILGKPAVVRDLGKYKVMIASMDLSIVRPTKLLNRPYLFYLLSTHMFHSHAQGYSNGTTVIHLSRKAVPEFPFIIPSEEILNNFKEFSNYLFDKISINQKSIKSLEKTRDLLLHKLMTGKIRVPLKASQ